MNSNSDLIFSEISFRSFSFSAGHITVSIPPRWAAKAFSFNPPIGRIRPRKVISPVMAISFFTGIRVRADAKAVAIAIPAEGPSLGIAPSGTWI